MNEPKMILKVEVLDGFRSKLTLLEMHDIFKNNMVHNYTTKGGWRFTMGDKLQVLKGLTILPKKVDRNTYMVKLNNEKQRYNYLKDLHEALLTLSEKYSDVNFSFESEIKFQGNMWLLF